MRTLFLTAAVLCGASSAIAQDLCDPFPAQNVPFHDPILASNWMPANGMFGQPCCNSWNLLFDLEVKASSIQLNEMGILLLDAGQHAITPDQTGNRAIVNIYTVATTWVGNAPTITPWNLVGVGELEVRNGTTTGYSPVTGIVDPNTNAPVVIPNGVYGVAVEVVPTNAVGTPPPLGPNGANAGVLHALVNYLNPGFVTEDQFIKLDNDALFTFGWHQTGTGPGPFPLVPATVIGQQGGSINFTIDYQVAPGDGGTLAYGAGCGSDPHTAYEVFSPGPNGPDLVDPSTPIGAIGGMKWTLTGDRYTVTPTSAPFVPPSSPNLLQSPPAQCYCAPGAPLTWERALSNMYSFPATWTNGGFQHAGGVATQFGVTSTGSVYLDVLDPSAVSPPSLGPPYQGGVLGATQNVPSIRPWYCNVDPTIGAASGIYVDYDPGNAWIRVTWDQLEEPGDPSSVSTFQLTMFADGSFDMGFVSLSNTGPNSIGVCGYFEGNGAPVGNPVDWSVLVNSAAPFTGNGATPPVLQSDARPRIGTTINFVTGDIIPGTLAGVMFFTQASMVPVDLAPIGAPDCFAHVDINSAIASLSLGLNPSNEFSQPLVIPNNPVFLSTSFHAQTATLVPGVNQLGALTSNALCVNVGN